MKTLIRLLSFLSLKLLLLFLVFECYLWLLDFSINFFNTILYLTIACNCLSMFRWISFFINVEGCFLCSKNSDVLKLQTTNWCCHLQIVITIFQPCTALLKKKFLWALWGLALAKKYFNNINNSHAQVSGLYFFLWLCFNWLLGT